MDQIWQIVAAWFATGAWWPPIVEFILPSVAILVPTIIAIRLASAERRAAAADRVERTEREKAERVALGVDYAGASMQALVEAAYEPDFMAAAKIRFRSLSPLDRIRFNLGPENDVVWEWIVEELKIVAGGLEDKTALNLPVLMKQIVHRGARFTNALSDWRMGEIDLEWFGKAEHHSLAETTLLEEGDDGR